MGGAPLRNAAEGIRTGGIGSKFVEEGGRLGWCRFYVAAGRAES